jgi:hypothetical protein
LTSKTPGKCAPSSQKPLWIEASPRVSSTKFNNFIVSFGLERSQSYPCIYYHHLRPGAADEETTFFVLFVDDCLILSNHSSTLSEIIDFLGKDFEVRSLPADRFIGVDIERNHTQQTIDLSQPEYKKNILERFGITQCNPVTFLADPCVKLSPLMCPRTEEEKVPMVYGSFLERVGSILHLANFTLPEISYAI